MAIQYSNLPLDIQVQAKSSSDDTVKFFDSYNKEQLQFKGSTSDAVVAFFRKKGMEEVAAKSTAFLLLKQCKLDGVDPLTIIDTLRQYSGLQLDNALGQVLNINRVKISALGVAKEPVVNNPAKRNIVA